MLIGSTESPSNKPPSIARNIAINRCWFMDCDIAVSIGNADTVSIDHCLMLDQSKCCVEIRTPTEKSRRPSNITMSWNTIQWQVGRLSNFFCNLDLADRFTLESNLWWSQEMPEAADYLGPFPDDAKSNQIITVDPKLTPRTLKQKNPESFLFGPLAQITNANPSKTNSSTADNAEDLGEEKKKRE